jgi:hypothetical protein
MGVVDTETVSTRLGYDWKTVSERLAVQKKNNENIGSFLLDFNKGNPF